MNKQLVDSASLPSVDMQTSASPIDALISAMWSTDGKSRDDCLAILRKSLEMAKNRYEYDIISHIIAQLEKIDVDNPMLFDDAREFWENMLNVVFKVDLRKHFNKTEDELASLLSAKEVPLLDFLTYLPPFFELGIPFNIQIPIRGEGGIIGRTTIHPRNGDSIDSEPDDDDTLSKYPCQERDLPKMKMIYGDWNVNIYSFADINDFINTFCYIPQAGIDFLLHKGVMVKRKHSF
jgi:hypothetical protein